MKTHHVHLPGEWPALLIHLSLHDPWAHKFWPFPTAPPSDCSLLSSGLQRLALQDLLDLFGIQSFIQEQSFCQFFVVFGVRLQQSFGTFIRLLGTETPTRVKRWRLNIKGNSPSLCTTFILASYDGFVTQMKSLMTRLQIWWTVQRIRTQKDQSRKLWCVLEWRRFYSFLPSLFFTCALSPSASLTRVVVLS